MITWHTGQWLAKYVDFRKTKSISGDLAFFFFVLLFTILFLCIAFLSNIQNFIFGKNDDLIFSLPFALVFPFPVAFSFLFLADLIHEIFNLSKKKNIKYEESFSKEEKENEEEIKYIEKLHRNYNIFVITFIIICSLISIASLSSYIRINDSGIYISNKYPKEKYYSWNELNKASISLGKNDNPEFIIEFADKKEDIWGGLGLGSPNYKKLIKLTDLILQNSNIGINISENFTEENISRLNKNSSAMYNINEFYKYLRNIEKAEE